MDFDKTHAAFAAFTMKNRGFNWNAKGLFFPPLLVIILMSNLSHPWQILQGGAPQL